MKVLHFFQGVNMEKTFYTITIFKNKNKMGETLKSSWKQLNTAIKHFEALKNSNNYESIILRKQEETYSSKTGLFICSVSSPINIYNK